MLKKISTFYIFQLLVLPVLASEKQIAQKQVAIKHVEKLKKHIPLRELQTIILEYIGNETITIDKTSNIKLAALSLNGIFLVSAVGANKKIVKIWKFDGSKYKSTNTITLSNYNSNIIKAAISNDGKQLALEIEGETLSKRYRTLMFQLEEDNCYVEKQAEAYDYESNFLEFFGNSKLFARAFYLSRIDILQLSAETNVFSHPAYFDNPERLPDRTGEGVLAAAISPDDTYIAGETAHSYAALWSLFHSKIKFINESKLTQNKYTTLMGISPNAGYIATNNLGEQAVLLNIYRKTNNGFEFNQKIYKHIIATLSEESQVKLLKFSHDGIFLALATYLMPEHGGIQYRVDILKLNQKTGKYEKTAMLPGTVSLNPILVGFSPDNSVITINNHCELVVWENQKEKLEQDASE